MGLRNSINSSNRRKGHLSVRRIRTIVRRNAGGVRVLYTLGKDIHLTGQIMERIAEIGEQREQRKARKRELYAFYRMLKATGPILEFDEELWNVAVERITIQVKGEFVIWLRNDKRK